MKLQLASLERKKIIEFTELSVVWSIYSLWTLTSTKAERYHSSVFKQCYHHW